MAELSDAIASLERNDWRAAHLIVQNDGSALGCWLHGIVHLMEGDISNARYWYAQAHRPFSAEFSAESELQAAKRQLPGADNHQ